MMMRIALACIAWAAARAEALAQQSWPIMCRSGGGVTFGVQQDMRTLRSIPCECFSAKYNIPARTQVRSRK
jgi:hypothetical protein